MSAAASTAGATKYVDRVIGTAASGTTGGLFNNPQEVAVNRTGAGGVLAGTIYVADAGNNRVQRFSSAGTFQRAWGADVVASGPDNGAGTAEVQQLTVTASSGTFALTYDGQQTSPIAYNAPATGASSVQAALNALSSIGGVGGSVSVTGGPGNATGSAPYTITFGGGLGGADEPQISVDPSGLGLAAGTTLTCSTTTTATTKTFRWLRNGVPIAGATAATYTTVTPADDGAAIQCQVFTINANAGATQISTPAQVGSPAPTPTPPVPPASLNAPTPGSPNSGKVETCAPGTWSGSPTFSYQWYKNGVAIAGATSSTYTLVAADVPSSLQCAVTGTNAGGATTLVSANRATSPAPSPAAPVATAAVAALTTTSTVTPGVSVFEICTVATNCKAAERVGGTASTAGNGGMSVPMGIAVDGDTGDVYVADSVGLRINVYSADGSFKRSFGFDVVGSGPDNVGAGYEICVQANGDVCKAGTSGNGIGQSASAGFVSGPDIVITPPDGNPATGKVYASDPGNRRIDAYNLDGTVPASIGSTANFLSGFPRDLAIDGGILYSQSNNNAPRQIVRYSIGSASFISPLDVDALTGAVTTTAGITGLDIDPDTGNLLVARGSSAYGAAAFSAPGGTPAFTEQLLTTLNPVGVDAGPTSGEVIEFSDNRVMILNDGGTPADVTINGTTDVTSTSATLNATIDSSGGLPTDYQLQYSRNGSVWATASSGTVAAAQTQIVSGSATGLNPNTGYTVRVLANRSLGNPDVTSSEGVFVTDSAPPGIVSTGADAVLTNSARLYGYVNPNSSQTSYRFEWGTTTGTYPNRVPMPNFSLGSGPSPVLAAQTLSGLAPATRYYFRLVAVSATDGTTTSAEEHFTTRAQPVASRVAELVSPADKGVGIVNAIFNTNLLYQVAPDGQQVEYPIVYGDDNATTGGDVEYIGARNPAGWASAQLSAAATDRTQPSSIQGELASAVEYLSPDLACSVMTSAQELTPDTPPAMRDQDGSNLFARDASGAYRLLTPVTPTNVGDPALRPLGFPNDLSVQASSSDCRNVVLKTAYRYPGLDNTGLYQSREGVLRNVAELPDGSAPTANLGAIGESGSVAVLGSGVANGTGITWRAASVDGQRVYFTAGSNAGSDLGTPQLYLRRNGLPTVKVSASTTGTASTGAYYQGAATDGSKVAFMANYGLTPSSSSGPQASDCRAPQATPCALYIYDAISGALTDLSATSNPANTSGAVVDGLIAASDDLTRIYFAAKGQLVTGQGSTYAQNVAGSTANIYLSDEHGLHFVTTVAENDLRGTAATGGMLARTRNGWQAQATPDGQHLLFSATSNLVGYDSGGQYETYAYDANTGLTCLSCRSDGEPAAAMDPSIVSTIAHPVFHPIAGTYYPIRSISDNGTRAFFLSADALAPGAANGDINVYVWDRGVVQLLTSGPAPGSLKATSVQYPRFDGASASGDDAFITTVASLHGADTNGVYDLYDFRVGGGFLAAPALAAPCAPLAGGCQSAGPTAFTPMFATTHGGQPAPAVVPRGVVSVKKLSAADAAALALGRSAGLDVVVNRPGRIVVRGTSGTGRTAIKALSGSRAAPRAGTFSVSIKLTSAARTKLAASRILRIRFVATFSKAREPATSLATLRLGTAKRRTARPSERGARR